jgi:hypothetical protein
MAESQIQGRGEQIINLDRSGILEDQEAIREVGTCNRNRCCMIDIRLSMVASFAFWSVSRSCSSRNGIIYYYLIVSRSFEDFKDQIYGDQKTCFD